MVNGAFSFLERKMAETAVFKGKITHANFEISSRNSGREIVAIDAALLDIASQGFQAYSAQHHEFV